MFWGAEMNNAQHTYHFSFWRTGTGAWKTILRWCFSFFLRELKLLHVQPVSCDPLIQALVDFKHRQFHTNKNTFVLMILCI